MPARAAMPETVTGIDEGVGRRIEDSAGAAGGKDRRLAVEGDDLAGLHLERDDPEHLPRLVADQIERHPLDEELRVGTHVALIERVQHRVASAVGGGAGAANRLLAEVRHVAAERTLVDLAFVGAVERHAEMFEFDDHLRRLATHVFDRVLVAEPVGALDRVVHVPVPVIFLGVAERGGDAALRRHGVRTGRKDLRQDGRLQAGFGKLNRCPQARTPSTDDHGIELAYRYGLACSLTFSTESETPSRRSRRAPSAVAIISSRRKPSGLT
jgi:hypothetical protein